MSTLSDSVVIGVDNSRAGISAARWGAGLAAAFDTPVHIVFAVPPFEELMRDITGAQSHPATTAHQWGEEVLDRVEQAIRDEFPDVKLTRSLSRQAAANTLKELSQQARFIVLGADQVSPGAALLVGSTTMTVATHAACPVLVWRGTHAALTDQPIVVGVDGSDNGNVALEVAFELAHRSGVDIIAVHAWTDRLPVGEVTVPFVIDWEAVEGEHHKLLTDTLAPWRQRYPDVEVTCHVDPHGPAQSLLRHSAGAQLIVVGNRGRNMLRSLLLGSTTLNLLHHSALPVMVCR
ncbi:universal stress protein [Micromonospora sp. WMMD736]|uniref:universal stress protein n=1 Tax=Micromonospora sp. WMMD736 TaxID=3404112 RepID=UPI003B964B22